MTFFCFVQIRFQVMKFIKRNEETINGDLFLNSNKYVRNQQAYIKASHRAVATT